MLVKDLIQEYSVRNKEKKDYPVYSVTNSQGFCKDYFGKEVASKDKSTYKIVPYGCFAYNPSRINVGSIDWQHCEDFVIVSPLYNVFTVNTNITRQDYLSYYFKSHLVSDYINTFAKGSVRLNVPLSTLGNFPVPIPPLAEQERIVAELDLLSSIIDKKKVQLKELDQLAQSIFYTMFGDPITNEKGWEVKKLGEVCEYITDGDHMPPPKSDSGIPFLTIGNINKETRELDFKNTFFVPQAYYDNLKDERRSKIGDILYTVTGSYGIPIIVKTEKLFCFQRHIALIRPKHNIILTQFLCSLLLTPSMKNEADMAATGIAQKTVGLSSLRRFIIPLPPLPLQQEFASKVEAIERQKSLIQQSIVETQTLFDSRMEHWFN